MTHWHVSCCAAVTARAFFFLFIIEHERFQTLPVRKEWKLNLRFFQCRRLCKTILCTCVQYRDICEWTFHIIWQYIFTTFTFFFDVHSLEKRQTSCYQEDFTLHRLCALLFLKVFAKRLLVLVTLHYFLTNNKSYQMLLAMNMESLILCITVH